MESRPRSIQSLLYATTPEFGDFGSRVQFLARIRKAMLEALPDSAASSVQVAAYEGFCLRLHVANASWATRLRYMQPAIARALAGRMRLHVERLEVRVRPDAARPVPQPRRPRAIAVHCRRRILEVAGYIDDPALAEALIRLAASGRDAKTVASR